MKTNFIKLLITTLLILFTTTQVWSQKITFVGSFTNFIFTTEHQYGAEVKLWQVGEKVFGTFSYSDGLAGDTPIGLLENISFDNKTRKLSYSSKLSTGIHGCNIHANIYSKDLFTFNGVIKKHPFPGY
jgi:hypothetical protein